MVKQNLIYMSIHTIWIVKYRSQIPSVNRRINRLITYMKYSMWSLVRENFENDKIFRRRSATYDLGWIKLRKIKSDGLCFRRTSSKSSLYMSTSFGRAENRSPLVWETRGDCCPKSLKEKQIILYSQHLPKKTFSLIASRKEKKYMKYCENHVFVWKL